MTKLVKVGTLKARPPVNADIHHLDKRISSSLRRADQLSSTNSELIHSYFDAMILDSVSNAVKDKHPCCLLTTSKIVDADWDTVPILGLISDLLY